MQRLDERCAANGRAAEVAVVLPWHDRLQHKTCRLDVLNIVNGSATYVPGRSSGRLLARVDTHVSRRNDQHTSPRRLRARWPVGKLVYRPTAVSALPAHAAGSAAEQFAVHSSKLQAASAAIRGRRSCHRHGQVSHAGASPSMLGLLHPCWDAVGSIGTATWCAGGVLDVSSMAERTLARKKSDATCSVNLRVHLCFWKSLSKTRMSTHLTVCKVIMEPHRVHHCIPVLVEVAVRHQYIQAVGVLDPGEDGARRLTAQRKGPQVVVHLAAASKTGSGTALQQSYSADDDYEACSLQQAASAVHPACRGCCLAYCQTSAAWEHSQASRQN